MRVLAILLLLVGLCGDCCTQTFSDIAQSLGIDVHVYSNLHGAGVSFMDFDNDGYDDLTFTEDGVIKCYKNSDASAVPVYFPFQVDDNVKHPVWVDFDNDGDLDFFFTQSQHANKLYRCDGDQFTDVTACAGLTDFADPSYGCSWGDYDRDGLLDLYVCNYVYAYAGSDQYNYYNHLYHNNGDGTFSDVTTAAGVSDGISLSFQSIWLDINRDMWPDLYVINDLEHPNRLYLNNTDGTFQEIGMESGSAVTMADAMSASAGDFNNDGWEDIFITNVSIQSCVLLLNNGDNTFNNISGSAGTSLGMLCWGAAWFDYDLDQDLDLYVSENFYAFPNQPNPMLRNNGNNTFSNIGPAIFLFDQTNTYTCAVGDWNDDGSPDIATNNFEEQNASLWLNSGADNDHVKVKLQGVVSNANGIGAMIECHCGSVTQTRWIYCGENYMAQNGAYEIFGLGSADELDSLIVHWPSGHVDGLYDLQTNTSYTIIEGSAWSQYSGLSEYYSICEGDSMLIQVSDDLAVEWSDSSPDDATFLSPGESLVALVSNNLGFAVEMSIEGVVDPGVPYEIAIGSCSCYGEADGSLELSFDETGWNEFQWSTAEDSLAIDSLTAGWYTFEYLSPSGCWFEESVEVPQPDSLWIAPSLIPPTCYGESNGTITGEAIGGVPPYNWLSEFPMEGLVAGEYELLLGDSAGCTAEILVTLEQPDSLFATWELDCVDGITIDLNVAGGIGSYLFEWSNGSLAEDVYNSDDECLSVNITDVYGCGWSSPDICCMSDGLEELHTSNSIYPNPVRRGQTLECVGSNMSKAMIFDCQGKTLVSGSSCDELLLTNLKPGLYVLVLDIADGPNVTSLLQVIP